MALGAGISSFASELEAIEKADYSTTAEKAGAFASAFANFFGYAQLTGIPITYGTNNMPAAVSACEGLLIGAFTAPNLPPASSLAMQGAFLAYLNAGLSTMWPSVGVSATSVVTLESILVPVMIPKVSGPKVKLATGIMNWLMSGAQITITPSPYTTFVT